MKNNLAICVHGAYTDNITSSIILDYYKEEYDTYIFENFSSNNDFENLNLCCFKKISHEVKNNMFPFTFCISLNPLYIKDINVLPKILQSNEKLNFLFGKFDTWANGTGIYPWYFYSSNLIFNRACEFLLADDENTYVKDKEISVRFYYFLKMNKIKTSAIYLNDENFFKIKNI